MMNEPKDVTMRIEPFGLVIVVDGKEEWVVFLESTHPRYDVEVTA